MLSDIEKNTNYTILQLLDVNFKNENGESNIEVRQRMKECIFSILKKYKGKNIAIISHGAAIKFFMQEFCEFDSKLDTFKYCEEEVFPRNLKSPSMLEISFGEDFEKKDIIKSIKYME